MIVRCFLLDFGSTYYLFIRTHKLTNEIADKLLRSRGLEKTNISDINLLTASKLTIIYGTPSIIRHYFFPNSVNLSNLCTNP